MFGRKKKIAAPTYLDLVPPLSGKVISLEEVEDEAFSSKAMGEGFAILPDLGKVTAPFDGVIAHIMEKSKHAILIEHTSGIQVLIHVGMNTVALKGEGFNAHVRSGEQVKKGQLLLEFDMDTINRAGYSIITPVVVPAGQDCVQRVEQLEGEAILRIHYLS